MNPNMRIKPMLEKALLLKYKGQVKSAIVRGERVSAARVERAIEHYGILDQFKGTGKSNYIVPSLEITEADIAPYYEKTVANAAKALHCEYNKFRSAIIRKGLFHNFTCNGPGSEKIYCPICRTTEVDYKYKMCQPCKGPAWDS